MAHGTFPADVIAAAQAANAKWRVPASVSMAQWALESGWGDHTPIEKDAEGRVIAVSNNPFGIKAPRDARGNPVPPCMPCETKEYRNGQYQAITDYFRKFASIAEAFDYHGRLLATASPYAHAMAVCRNPIAFAEALTGHYATDPNYGATLIRIMAIYDLQRYDAPRLVPVLPAPVVAAAPAPAPAAPQASVWRSWWARGLSFFNPAT